ncbi:MAG: nucleoside hydrolase [Deltaproteobacteria bacterium]|nr:nucleoside hydrolase [Deltaproteobacteria bacterium]
MPNPLNNPTPILLDMDPGVDDALAIILASRSPQIDVKAITVCGGNVGVEQCALNTIKTLDWGELKSKPPVAMGAWRPVRRSPFRAGGIHGPDGLGDVLDRYPNPSLTDIDPRPAVDLILHTLRELPPNSLTIVATAPLTNIALAISKDPETVRRAKQIIWMGGAFTTHGNISPVAEFNAFCDPDAAAEVLNFSVPMTVVGLDACLQCPLTRDELRSIRECGRAGAFVWDICQMYMDFYQKNEGFDGCFLHDPLAVSLAIWDDITADQKNYHVDVVTEPGVAWGQTIIDRRPRYPWHNPIYRHAYDTLKRMAPDTLASLEEVGVCEKPPHLSIVFSVDGKRLKKRFLKCF